MAEIMRYSGITPKDWNPDQLLDEAMGKLDECIIIGHDKDGDFYFDSSKADGGTIVWLLEKAKKKLLEAGENP